MGLRWFFLFARFCGFRCADLGGSGLWLELCWGTSSLSDPLSRAQGFRVQGFGFSIVGLRVYRASRY